MAFVRELVGDKWQPVDHERGLRLETIHGGRGEYHFHFHVGDEIVNIYAVYNSKVHGHPKLGEIPISDLYWQLRDVFIPPSLKDKQEEILKWIEEALKARGMNTSQERDHNVHISLLKNAIK